MLPDGSPGLANETAIDDLSFGVPDTTSTLSLLGAASLGLMALRRKVVAA